MSMEWREKSLASVCAGFLIALALLFTLSPAHGQGESTILTAQRVTEPITIDGVANESAWSGARKLVVMVRDGSIGSVDVSMQALYDAENLYLHVTWPDPTESRRKKQWIYSNGRWSVSSEDEDRFSIIWNINDSIEGFNIGGCAMLCHGDRMHTNKPGEKGDVWHWKAARTDPAGYADDQLMNSTVVPEDWHGSIWTGRQSDEKTGGGYRRNINEEGNGPRYYEPEPVDEEDAAILSQEEIERGEAVEVTPATVFEEGEAVPGYIVERAQGSRGDIEAKGVWSNGYWSLELKRRLSTGHSDDVEFDVTRTYRFGIAVMDNTGGFEAFGKGHSFDLGARTLEFGGTGSEDVTTLTLMREYLVNAQVYAGEGNRGLAISSVTDAQVLYNTVRDAVAKADPKLHITIVRELIEGRRDPTPEGLGRLIKAVDDASLTLQGKRKPEELSLGLWVLALWGRVQLYVFVFLGILVIYPLYRILQTTRKPEVRHFGLFLFMFILPVFLEGMGRLGILLGFKTLQNLSFTTNEYVTLLWALGMFIALMFARLGFNEVDHTISSLRKRTTELMQSNRLKDIFTDIMRHDLLNPIGLIRTHAELLAEEELDGVARQDVEEILHNANKAVEMIDSASRLAKLEATEEMEYEEVDVGELLDEAARDLKPIAEEKKIEIENLAKGKRYPAGANKVIYDVFSNLISNAIKYSPEGSKVTLGIEDEGGSWKIYVKDQGEGVPDEYKKEIFDRFLRMHKGAVVGTGLGLTIVKKIVEMHDGRVWVEDNPEGGSIFYVTLPKHLPVKGGEERSS